MIFLWSQKQWLHFEEFWEVSVVVVKKLQKLDIGLNGKLSKIKHLIVSSADTVLRIEMHPVLKRAATKLCK